MKIRHFLILAILALNLFSCGEDKYYKKYYKCFFLAESSFDIEGEIFIGGEPAQEADLEKMVVKADMVKNWEIEGEKIGGNKFRLTVDVTANGISLPTVRITPDGPSYDLLFERFPKGFQYYIINFYVNGRRTRGVFEPGFHWYYFYVYIPKLIDLSEEKSWEVSDNFGGTSHYYESYDLIFDRPGWYKIYRADEPIGNKESYSSGANTIVSALK
jgi:hypothetical protein